MVVGVIHHLLLIFFGAFLVQRNDARNHPLWIGHSDVDHVTIMVLLEEDAVEKPASFKTLASVRMIIQNKKMQKAQGRIIIYFKKDTALLQHLRYGNVLVFHQRLQPISNSGNPGSFDYRRYCLLNGITHQVYLTPEDLAFPGIRSGDILRNFINATRKWIIQTIREYVPGKKEQGLAEALLIGYKDDLEKDLVQAYANTGVVHVIAISGLHLGLIYWILLLLTKPLKSSRIKWLRFIVVISGLWVFSFLAGAQPSVLRSAVMFSFLATATAIGKKSSIYNTLALSAFLLLCYNPFWLWDAGFQLSYSAVLSIMIFYKPVYNRIYFTNALMDAVWKLMAVTLAAQLLTLPISLYHFHQFPLLFLFTNVVAVPLSSFILIGELIICCLFFYPPLAATGGWFFSKCIWVMNSFVEYMDRMPFAVWDRIYITEIQTLLLYVVICGTGIWLLVRKVAGCRLAALAMLLFMMLRSSSFYNASAQAKLVVFNLPKKQGIDLYFGRRSWFIGDTAILRNKSFNQFHMQPARVLHRVNDPQILNASSITYKGISILLINDNTDIKEVDFANYDIIIVSGNPEYSSDAVAGDGFKGMIVVSSTVPSWKARTWRSDCQRLGLMCYDVVEKGAFVVSLYELPLRPRRPG